MEQLFGSRGKFSFAMFYKADLGNYSFSEDNLPGVKVGTGQGVEGP